ncbi:MAG: hypothetical protein ABI056_05955 [Caulobacteraceae bacterium]
MTKLSPVAAASEGFRLIRREPGAFLAWTGLWLAWFVVTAVALASGRKVVVATAVEHRTLWQIVSHFGAFTALLVGVFLLLWGTTAVAVFRAVLQPGERRFFYLRLGRDELRMALISLALFILAPVFGGAPTFLLIALFSPLMAAIPAAARDIAEVGALITVAVEVWLWVRLSLIAVETFDERRFHLSAYWPLTRGRFWYLLGCYVVFFLIVFFLTALFLSLTDLIVQAGFHSGIGKGDLWRRGGILGLALIVAALTAAWLMVCQTLFCACQACAYAVIAGSRAEANT